MTKDNEADKEGASTGVVLERIVSCDYCKEDGENIFEFEMLWDWFGGFCGDAPITPDNAVRENHAVFIDRGFLRMVDVGESQCMDHGEKVKIKYCPFCGTDLSS